MRNLLCMDADVCSVSQLFLLFSPGVSLWLLSLVVSQWFSRDRMWTCRARKVWPCADQPVCRLWDAFEVPASSHSALTQPSFFGSPLCIRSVYAARNVWGAHLRFSTALLSSGSSSEVHGLFAAWPEPGQHQRQNCGCSRSLPNWLGPIEPAELQVFAQVPLQI